MTVWAQNYIYYWAPAPNPRSRARPMPKTSKPGALRAQILRAWCELLEASHSPGQGAGRVHKQPASAGVWLPMGLPARGLCPPRPLHTYICGFSWFSTPRPIFIISGWVLLLPGNVRSLAATVEEILEKPAGSHCPDPLTLPDGNEKMKQPLGDRHKIKIWAHRRISRDSPAPIGL